MGLKSLLLAALRTPILQPLALRLLKRRADLHNDSHPFDAAHGIDTSGWVPAQYLYGDRDAANATIYAGCVPSAVMTALGVIPDLAGAHFLDLGCGKGRALIVARAFPFAALTGIELSPALAAKAQANAAIVAARAPDGPPISVLVGDASAPQLPAGDCVAFLYHPFGRALIDKLVAALTVQALARPWRTFIVYENPVHGAAFDAAGPFQRFYAAQVPYAPQERGFGPDTDEPVAIWVNREAGLAPLAGADAAIVVTKPDWRAEIRPRPADAATKIA